MATLLKHPNGRSPNWYAVWTDASGRQHWKSSRTKDKALALQFLALIEEQERSARMGRFTAAAAREALSEISQRATGEALHFSTAEEFFSDWLKDKRGAKAKKTFVKYEQVSRHFLSSLRAKAKQPLGAITPVDVREWTEDLRRGGRSATTVRDSLKVVSSVFEKAKRLGYIQVNPCHAISPERDTEKQDREGFSREQIQALVKEAKGTDWEGVILAGYCTGLRLSDITGLRWAAVEIKESGQWFIRFQTQKWSRKILAGISEDFRVWLESRPRGIGQAPVFPSLCENDNGGRKDTGGRNGLSGLFKQIMERAGVEGRMLRKGEGAGRTTYSLSFHSLRHAMITAMAAAGVPEDVRQKIAGQSTKAVHRIYNHAEYAEAWRAVSAIPSL